jgi:hypothetical protein
MTTSSASISPVPHAPDEDVALDVAAEFDRQVATLHRLGYPGMTGLADDALDVAAAKLRVDVVARIGPTAHAATPGRAPFVLVVPASLVPAERAMPLTALGGRPGFVSGDTADIATFAPIDGLDIPARTLYALIDVRRGEEFCNVTPKAALVAIRAAGRSPLTYDEGIALLTHQPTTLAKNKCFSLSGSRCGDKRVPALWISDRRPKLGWCWDGNPHTWLGSAHTGGRC